MKLLLLMLLAMVLVPDSDCAKEEREGSREFNGSDISSMRFLHDGISKQHQQDVVSEQPLQDGGSKQHRQDAVYKQPRQDGVSKQPRMDNDSMQPVQDGVSKQSRQDGVSKQHPQNGVTKQPRQNGVSKEPRQDDVSKQPRQDGVSKQPQQDGDSNIHRQDTVSKQPRQNGVSKQSQQDGDSKQPRNDGVSKQPRKDFASIQLQRDGISKQPRQDGVSKQPRQDDISKQPRQDGVSSELGPRQAISCSRSLVTTTIAPGDHATFQSPNYPNNYEGHSLCKWRFESTTDITITCSDFLLQQPNQSGKCQDKVTIDGNQFCGHKLKHYSGDSSVTVVFKSNRNSHFTGFLCTATAASNTSCNCGQPNRALRIVGGVETEVLEYPWQAAMVYYGTTSVFCGASVIGTKHLLTAAHCTQAVTDYSMTYQVLVGAHNLISPATSQQNMDAFRFIQHPGYDDLTYDNDISIIELSGSISFTDTDIRPVCLPTSDDEAYDSVTATVSGWGVLESSGSQPDVLMEVDVPTISNSQCQSYYGDWITDNMICAGFEAGGSDSCQGDSGGPLAYNSGSSYTQIGVVSWGVGCALPNYPGVYARVSKYLSWISTNSASSTTCSSNL